ncbi:cation diffusion facilitator family transporter [Paludibaculum fermentans]|uniref:cation diffusion facilitator family transporter n=1 Tax=Paludibaculum fermentans TaxID=1473598 RepID=UPI003EBCEEC2
MTQSKGSDAPVFAMRLSLWTGVVMLVAKSGAWLLTGSSAIFSDALESIIHLAAVAFASFSLWLSRRPANERFHYGYERITFFSAGFEGALIAAAAVAIIVTAIYKWMQGLQLEALGLGALITLAAGLLNGGLGWYLIRTGRRNNSIILIANGQHVFTDCWTSLGVIVGLLLVMVTGWKPFDPICAILMAVNILWSGGKLMWTSARGLLDYADPDTEKQLRARLAKLADELGVEYHELKLRETGGRVLVELHLLFPDQMPIVQAHAMATQVEAELAGCLDRPVEIITHLEGKDDHEERHPRRR